jgi:hypothetical protein
MEKYFMLIDKSGKGFISNRVPLEDVLGWPNEEDNDGQELHEWAEEAEPGDKWITQAEEVICIESITKKWTLQ